MWNYLFVLGIPAGSFVGGYMFNRIGSISSFKLLSAITLAICFLQIIVNQSINRISKDENVNKEYNKATVLYSSVESKSKKLLEKHDTPT